MAYQGPSRASIRSTRRLRSVWLRERRQRPVAYRLAVIAAATLALSVALVAMHLGPLAQLVGGLALVPLSLAAFFRLLPPPPWTDDGTDGRRHGQEPDRAGPWPPDEQGLEFDWDSFERQYRAFVEDEAFRPRR